MVKPCADCITMGQVIPWLALFAGELFLFACWAG
jgi:hypothetical protein